MKRMSIENAAKYYNGFLRCDNCRFFQLKTCTDEIMELCTSKFVEGFKKGAGYQRRKIAEGKK